MQQKKNMYLIQCLQNGKYTFPNEMPDTFAQNRESCNAGFLCLSIRIVYNCIIYKLYAF